MNRNSEDQAYQKQAEQRLAHPCEPDDAARAHLTLGCVHEHDADWTAAIESYRQVLANEQQDVMLLYFGNNNLGFCLIQLGRFDEAEDYCRTAIEIDEERHNAHKNLGLALLGQGRRLDAALSLLEAANLQPMDPRAARHLEQLLGAHPMLLQQSVTLRTRFETFRRGVDAGAGARMH